MSKVEDGPSTFDYYLAAGAVARAVAARHSAADFDAVEDRTLFDPVRKRADV